MGETYQKNSSSSGADHRKLWISVANVSACFAVVILHCNSIFHQFPSGRLWYTSNFIETFFYWTIPVFFMITGTTLMDYRDRYSTRVYFQKRIERTVFPFLFWSLIALLVRVRISGWPLGSPADVITNILNTRYNQTYWFFPALFSVYLVLPLLSAVPKQLRERVFAYLFVCMFLLASLLPTLFQLAGMTWNSELLFSVSGGSGYALYLLLGYLLSRNELSRTQRMFIYTGSILGWAIQFFGTTALSFPAGQLVETFKGFTNFPAVLQSAGVFLALRRIPWEKILPQRNQSLIYTLSKYTFGVYLIQMYFIKAIPSFLHINIASILWRTVGAIGIMILCTGICALLSRIPVLRKTIGC